MTYPEDRVLVGVINRKRDFEYAQKEHWYRIPRVRAPRSIDAEYVAFYFSRAFKAQNGGIHYFARRTGYELVRRSDLLPNEKQRANEIYYKLELAELEQKIPPILNPTMRPISFIYTTWDRFVKATTIAELYSKADWFVERVAHVLRQMGIDAEQQWQDEDPAARIAKLRIQCQEGIVMATTGSGPDGSLNLLPGESDDDVNTGVEAIRAAVTALGGPVFVDIPSDG